MKKLMLGCLLISIFAGSALAKNTLGMYFELSKKVNSAIRDASLEKIGDIHFAMRLMHENTVCDTHLDRLNSGLSIFNKASREQVRLAVNYLNNVRIDKLVESSSSIITDEANAFLSCSKEIKETQGSAPSSSIDLSDLEAQIEKLK